MVRKLSSLWAKKDDSNGAYRWIPLLVHLDDTMNVAGWLWNHWISEGQRINVISQMSSEDESDAEKVVRFLGGIHDIGKATPAFQLQKGYSSSEDLDHLLLERLEHAGYSGISQLRLASPKSTHHSIAGQVLLERYGFKKDISAIVGAHHGKPVDARTDCEDQIAYPANYHQCEDPSSAISCFWTDTQNVLIQQTLEKCEFFNAEELPSFSEPAQVILSGLLIMADWIASNEVFFPMLPIDQEEVFDDATRFQAGIRAWLKTLPLGYDIRITYEKREP